MAAALNELTGKQVTFPSKFHYFKVGETEK